MARKVTMWAKAAGEYYRKNKGKNGIESFADVLKSEEFKMEYENKYKNKGTAKTMGKKEKKSMRNAKTLKVGGDIPTDATTPLEQIGGKNKSKKRTTKKSSYKLW